MTHSPPSQPEPAAEGEGGEPSADAVSDASRRELIAGVLVVLALVAAVAAKPVWRAFAPRPTERQCAALVERYVEHAARAMHPDVDDVRIERAKKQPVDESVRLADVTSCRRDLTAAQVECGLRAPNVDELERCMQ